MATFILAARAGVLRPALISHRLLLSQAKPLIGCPPNLVEKRDVHLTPVKRAAQATGKGHAAHWIAERAVAMSLFAVIPAAYFVPPCFAMDTALTASLVLHSHWGISGVFGDYMHGYPSETGERRLPILTTVAKVLPMVLSITAFACLTSFNYNDVGLVKAIAMLWRV